MAHDKKDSLSEQKDTDHVPGIDRTKLIKVFDAYISEGGRFEIPQEVTEISSHAFKDCTGLTTVIFNEKLTQIGNGAFSRCTGLTTVTFNENLTQIGNCAFSCCTGLTTVTFNENLTQIGNGAFDRCTRLTTVTLNEKLTQIDSFAFYGCASLTTMTFNEKLTQIGNGAFDCCTGLTMVTLNEKLTQIGNCAFNGCTRLTTVTLNKNLTQIGNNAFYGCASLTTVTLNEKLTQIGYSAFEGCTGLKKIVIDTEDDANFNRIRNLLPEELRARCIKKSLNEHLDRIKEDSLKSILAEPATNSMRRVAKAETYTHDVWLLLNKYNQESNIFYKKAKCLMDALDVPKSNDKEALVQFNEACKIICDDCLERAKRGIYGVLQQTFFPNKEAKKQLAAEESSNKIIF